MITAKTFASLGSVWQAATPSLEQFVRWVNANTQSYADPVRRLSTPGRSSLIAEIAFQDASRAASGEYWDTEDRARAALSGLAGAPTEGALSDDEDVEVTSISENLQSYVLGKSPEYGPVLRGCGLVGSAVADILISRDRVSYDRESDRLRLIEQIDLELIEVKAVDRGFRSLDLKQVLTYAALAYASGATISLISMLNPRRGHYYRDSVANLALDLGATSWFDLMQLLINEMSEVGPSL